MLQRTISALNLYRYSFEYLEITDQHKFSVVDLKLNSIPTSDQWVMIFLNANKCIYRY